MIECDRAQPLAQSESFARLGLSQTRDSESVTGMVTSLPMSDGLATPAGGGR
jgi:hypothetical protein